MLPRIELNTSKLSRDKWSEFGLDDHPLIDFKSIWDMFCIECRALLKPVRKMKKFRQDGKPWEVVYLVAWCYCCDSEFHVDHWIEVLFRRRVVDGLTLIIEAKQELMVLPTTKYWCKKCDKVVLHTYVVRQLRSGDESGTTFYRCTMCNTTERESL